MDVFSVDCKLKTKYKELVKMKNRERCKWRFGWQSSCWLVVNAFWATFGEVKMKCIVSNIAAEYELDIYSLEVLKFEIRFKTPESVLPRVAECCKKLNRCCRPPGSVQFSPKLVLESNRKLSAKTDGKTLLIRRQTTDLNRCRFIRSRILQAPKQSSTLNFENRAKNLRRGKLVCDNTGASFGSTKTTKGFC